MTTTNVALTISLHYSLQKLIAKAKIFSFKFDFFFVVVKSTIISKLKFDHFTFRKNLIEKKNLFELL